MGFRGRRELTGKSAVVSEFSIADSLEVSGGAKREEKRSTVCDLPAVEDSCMGKGTSPLV